jgi:GrpB-like predicted nucleotidyltransferase (UPF0157 family)
MNYGSGGFEPLLRHPPIASPTSAFSDGHDRWSALGPCQAVQGVGPGVLQVAGQRVQLVGEQVPVGIEASPAARQRHDDHRATGLTVHPTVSVASTASPRRSCRPYGLAARPIIDLDVVIADRIDLPAVIQRLRTLGYLHEGDLGVPGREAFTTPAGAPPHHLYVCATGTPALDRHLAFRDGLRADPSLAGANGDLKRTLAAQRVATVPATPRPRAPSSSKHWQPRHHGHNKLAV